MTLEYHFTNFYDSGFDYENESSICGDNKDILNIGFLESPKRLVSYVDDDASYSDLVNSVFLRKSTTSTNYEDFQKSSSDNVWEKMDIKSDRDEKSKMMEQAADLLEKSEENPQCVFTSTCVEPFPKTVKKYGCSKLKEQSQPVEEEWKNPKHFLDSSKKNEDLLDCVFASTSQDDFSKSSKEYDWGETEFEKWSNRKDGPIEKDRKIPVSVSRFDYVPHELSTILEVDSSLFLEKPVEPLLNSDENDSLFVQDLKNHIYSKAEDSFKHFIKSKEAPNFSVNVRKFIQNNHIEKLLQERGILEESDLTLITSDFASKCEISENFKNEGNDLSYYKINRFKVEDSPSLISFEQHELSCMQD